MKPRHRRLLHLAIALIGVAGIAFLVSRALSENLTFYYSPTQVRAGEAPADHPFRVGGLVVPGSVQRQPHGLTVRFSLTDRRATVPVVYEGILPDLFREGQGILARGRWEGEVFRAEEVLAKHDETYMPPEVADSLKKAERSAP